MTSICAFRERRRCRGEKAWWCSFRACAMQSCSGMISMPASLRSDGGRHERNRWSTWTGMSGRHQTEQLVGMSGIRINNILRVERKSPVLRLRPSAGSGQAWIPQK
jgi:hypothetical protein